MKRKSIILFISIAIIISLTSAVTVLAAPYTVMRDKIITADDLPTYTIVDFEEKTNVMKIENPKSFSTKAIRYGSLNLSAEQSSANRYMLVDCYLENAKVDSGSFDLTAVFRKTMSGEWITLKTDKSIYEQKSEKYPINKWVTVVIDCNAALQYLSENNYALDQMQINIPDTDGNFYIGKVRFTPEEIEPELISDVSLYADESACSWQNGDLTVRITFLDDIDVQEADCYAVTYSYNEDIVKTEDIRCISGTIEPNMTVDIPINVSDCDSTYMKVFVIDSNNKALCECVPFGSIPDIFHAADGDLDTGFYISNISINDTNVDVSGVDNTGSSARITIVAKNDDEILFLDQQKAGQNGGFRFIFDASSAFENGTKITSGGWYTGYISSNLSGNTLSERIGIARADVFDSVLAMMNEGRSDELKKVLSKDTEYEFEYTSLMGKELYLDELSKYDLAEDTADLLIAAKPDGGYTSGNLKEYFNKVVSEVVFDLSDDSQKLTMVEDDRYSELLGTKELVKSKAYIQVKETDQAAKLFDGIKASELAEKLKERLILISVSSAENSAAMRDIIEENADVLSIKLSAGYKELSSLQLKELYDKLIGRSYGSIAEIKRSFESALNAVTSRNSSSSGGGGGGGGGGSSSSRSSSGSGGSAVAPAVIKPDKEIIPPVPTSAPEANNTFNDVETLTWGRDEINYLAGQGIINGFDEKTFSPDSPITREQFCKIIALAYKIQAEADMPFKDIDESDWYAQYIASLYAGGYINGISEVEFGVGSRITRQDAAAIIYRIMKDTVASESVAAAFKDDKLIADYAKEAVYAMAGAGLINGYDDNTFGPMREITRREAAVILYRALAMTK